MSKKLVEKEKLVPDENWGGACFKKESYVKSQVSEGGKWSRIDDTKDSQTDEQILKEAKENVIKKHFPYIEDAILSHAIRHYLSGACEKEMALEAMQKARQSERTKFEKKGEYNTGWNDALETVVKEFSVHPQDNDILRLRK